MTNALRVGNLVVAEGLARELGRISLAEALEPTILIGRKEPRRLSKVSVRWLERYVQECDPFLAQVALAVSALSALCTPLTIDGRGSRWDAPSVVAN